MCISITVFVLKISKFEVRRRRHFEHSTCHVR